MLKGCSSLDLFHQIEIGAPPAAAKASDLGGMLGSLGVAVQNHRGGLLVQLHAVANPVGASRAISLEQEPAKMPSTIVLAWVEFRIGYANGVNGKGVNGTTEGLVDIRVL